MNKRSKQLIYLFLVCGAILLTVHLFSDLGDNTRFEDEVDEYRAENILLELQLNSTHEDLENTRSRKLSLATENNELKKQKQILENRLRRIRADYETWNRATAEPLPTPSQLKEIIKNTNTTEYEYIPYKFTCIDFTNKMIQQLQKQHIHSCSTTLTYNGHEKAHNIVTVNTTKGVRYIEPQTHDMFENLSLKDNYCDKIGDSCEQIIYRYSNCYERDSIVP